MTIDQNKPCSNEQGILKSIMIMEMATMQMPQTERMTMKKQMDDILVAISWGQLARTYFGKSASWFYHKMDGRDGNGKPTAFNPAEAAQLKGALCDLADRIRRCADSIEI